MWQVVIGLVLCLTWPAQATSVCATRDDQTSCPLSDGQTTGTCMGGACIRTFTVPAGEARTGTGTISSSGATVTGSGTAFTTELQIGDTLIVSGQKNAVIGIGSNTSLTTNL